MSDDQDRIQKHWDNGYTAGEQAGFERGVQAERARLGELLTARFAAYDIKVRAERDAEIRQHIEQELAKLRDDPECEECDVALCDLLAWIGESQCWPRA